MLSTPGDLGPSYFDPECISNLTFYVYISPEELVANLGINTYISRDIVPITELVRITVGVLKVYLLYGKRVLNPSHYCWNSMLLLTREVLLLLRLSFFTFTALWRCLFWFWQLCNSKLFPQSFSSQYYWTRAQTQPSLHGRCWKRQRVLLYLPRGITTKNGSQQRTKHPTTIPRVLAAFFSLENLRRRTEKWCLLLGLDADPLASGAFLRWIRRVTSSERDLSVFRPEVRPLFSLLATTYTRQYIAKIIVRGR